MIRGAVEAIIVTVCLWLAFSLFAFFAPMPSVRFFESTAQIEATLLVAFVLEVSWLVKTSNRRGPSQQEWVGFVSAIGLTCFAAILVSLALAEYLGAGHDNWLARLGFACVSGSLVLLGAMVALQPGTIFAWQRDEVSD